MICKSCRKNYFSLDDAIGFTKGAKHRNIIIDKNVYATLDSLAKFKQNFYLSCHRMGVISSVCCGYNHLSYMENGKVAGKRDLMKIHHGILDANPSINCLNYKFHLYYN